MAQAVVGIFTFESSFFNVKKNENTNNSIIGQKKTVAAAKVNAPK